MKSAAAHNQLSAKAVTPTTSFFPPFSAAQRTLTGRNKPADDTDELENRRLA